MSLFNTTNIDIDIEYEAMEPMDNFNMLRTRALNLEKLTNMEIGRLGISRAASSQEALSKKVQGLINQREALIRSMLRVQQFQRKVDSGSPVLTMVHSSQIIQLQEVVDQHKSDFEVYKGLLQKKKSLPSLLTLSPEHVNPFTDEYESEESESDLSDDEKHVFSPISPAVSNSASVLIPPMAPVMPARTPYHQGYSLRDSKETKTRKKPLVFTTVYLIIILVLMVAISLYAHVSYGLEVLRPAVTKVEKTAGGDVILYGW